MRKPAGTRFDTRFDLHNVEELFRRLVEHPRFVRTSLNLIITLFGHATSYRQGVAAEAGLRSVQRHSGFPDNGSLISGLYLLVSCLDLPLPR